MISAFWSQGWQRFKRKRSACVGILLLALIATGALLGPWFSAFAYDETNLKQVNQLPGAIYWFGTDDLGRDLFIRTWEGARVSLFIGIAAAFLDLVIGVAWGGIAGFAPEPWGKRMMDFVNILYALPYLLIVILLVVVMGSGISSVLLAMALTGWMTMARIVRGQMLYLKEQEYVLAAHSMGASCGRVLCRHLLPNALGPIIVMLTLTIPSAIFLEAYLSFLGLGVQAPLASWGSMVHDGLPAISYYPWRVFFPAILITLTILAFNLVGDGLREAFDVKDF